MSTSDPLPGFDDRAPRDRYCDLILTGGVTSAIAYPAAIFVLATAYRFNSIGGSSSGAGSAALAAAAEYRRRHGSSDGFRILLERTAALAEEDVNRRTGLRWLFQPAQQHKRLFDALVPGFARPTGKGVAWAQGLLLGYWAAGAIGIALACAVVLFVSRFLSPLGWIAYVSVSAIAAVIAVAVAVWRDVARVVNADFGLCDGLRGLPGAPTPALTQWLHNLIQEIAGRRASDAPLTFADLAAAPGSPRETLGDLGKSGAESINLQMFTANVTHGRPYLLPQTEEDLPLYFRPGEMRRLFPKAVVKHMMRQSSPYRGDAQFDAAARLLGKPGAKLWRLPTAQLPIVVASRMSISFPVLFTAVPLWALDPRAEPPPRDGEVRPPVFRRCLFSDGSLCSNFPIHLFDSPVPAWPTFGISLYDLPKSAEQDAVAPGERWSCEVQGKRMMESIKLPVDHREGRDDRWSDLEDRTGAFRRLLGFVGALFSTTKDWNDATLAQLPGVRDRVVRVGLAPGIGGLNILMTGEQIRCLGKVGGEAARKLLERFATPSGSAGMARGWSEHRWVRFNVLRDCLSSTLSGLTWSAAQSRFATPLREQILHAVDDAPLEWDNASQLLAAQAAALDGVLAALVQAERALTAPTAGQPYIASPRPKLGIRPPL